MPDSSVATILMLSLAAPYALVLAAPGPNLLVVLWAGLSPTMRGPVAAAIGIACGATLATLAAAYGASFFSAESSFRIAGRLVIAAVILRSALRLLAPPRPQTELARLCSGAPRAPLGPFAAGLLVAVSNPMTAPFFLGFFVSQPMARTGAGVALACVTVFTMASVWFAILGLVISRTGLGVAAARLGPRLRQLLGLVMLVCAAALLAGAVPT